MCKALIIVFLIYSSLASATMSPRMTSLMAQVNGSLGEVSNSNGTSKFSNRISFDLLYLVRQGPTFGGRYLIEDRNELETESGAAYGPSAGYFADSGFFGLVHYDIFAKLGRWTNGEGLQIDLGYVEHIHNHFHIGFKYSQRKITYKTDKSNNIALQKTVTDRFPSLVLMYLF